MLEQSFDNHEHYITHSTVPLYKKNVLPEPKSSLGVDSECNSSSSTPAYSITSSTSYISDETDYLGEKRTKSINKKKRQQSLRNTDIVYSCPRPLTFPFHNDDHFLPVAEADPRDVARMTPSFIDRSNSIQSKSSTKYSANSFYSRQSTLLGSIQLGTVRSIRSMFQLPNSISNTNESTQKLPCSHSKSQQSIERLEIKSGTVQSIKALFSRKQNQQIHQVQKPVSPLCTKRGQVGKVLGQFEVNCSRASFSPETSRTNISDGVDGKKSLSKRVSELAKRIFWKKSTPNKNQHPTLSTTIINNTSNSPATKPLPKQPIVQKPLPEPRKTLKSEVKKFSARVISSLRPSKNKNNTTPSKKKDDKIVSVKKECALTQAIPDNRITSNVSTVSDEPSPQKPSKVGKLWTSFKSLMTGRKSSRVGVL